MNCKHSENELALYVEGDLPEAKAKEVDGHLLACRNCRQVVDELTRSQSLFKSIRQETVGTAELADLRMRVMERVAVQKPKPFWGRWVYALAGATFVVVLIAGVLTREGHRGETSVSVVKTVPLPPPPSAQAVVPRAEEESHDLVKVNARRRRRPEAIQIKVSPEPTEQLKPMMVKLQTDDPNIVIYWLFDQNGGSL
jgi:predicted anti-sigma-YlaC factor YlaD